MSKVKFTDTEVAKIADLIKIDIPTEDLAKYGDQLSTVLDAAQVVQEVDTTNTKITAQTHGLVNVLREDEPEEGLDMQEYENKLNFNGKYFVVKKVL